MNTQNANRNNRLFNLALGASALIFVGIPLVSRFKLLQTPSLSVKSPPALPAITNKPVLAQVTAEHAEAPPTMVTTIFTPQKNLELIQNSAQALRTLFDTYSTNTDIKVFLTSKEMLTVSNALEALYGSYTNQVMRHHVDTNTPSLSSAKPLSQEEYDHAILVLKVRADVAIMYINPKSEVLFLPQFRSSPDYGPRIILDSVGKLCEQAKWISTRYETQTKL